VTDYFCMINPTTLLIFNQTLLVCVFVDVTDRPDDFGFEPR
jgi:hypothetical protein